LKTIRKVVLTIMVLATFFLLMGCTVKDMDVESIDISSTENADMELPKDVRAEIIVPLGHSAKVLIARNAYAFCALDDAKASTTTAKEVFKKLFKDVEPQGEIDDPHVIIKLKTKSRLNTFWGVFKVNVKAEIEYGDGQSIGKYEAKGSQVTALFSDYNALENAYRKAYLEIVRKMLGNQDTVAMLKREVDDTIVKITDKSDRELKSKYKKYAKSVVTIAVEKKNMPMVQWVNGDDQSFNYSGSGFYISSEGEILTNNHVISDAKSIHVIDSEGEKYPAEIISQNEWNDLALIKIDLKDSPFLNVDKNSKYVIGDNVIAIGSPYRTSFINSISKGIISSTRLIDGNKVIQTDAAVNPGSSGGPLIQLETGQVIGIVTLGVLGAEGIAFALPVVTIDSFIAASRKNK